MKWLQLCIALALLLGLMWVVRIRGQRQTVVDQEWNEEDERGIFRFKCPSCGSTIYLDSYGECTICGDQEIFAVPSGMDGHNHGLAVTLWLATCRASDCIYKTQRESQTLADVVGCPIHLREHMYICNTLQRVILSGTNTYPLEVYGPNA